MKSGHVGALIGAVISIIVIHWMITNVVPFVPSRQNPQGEWSIVQSPITGRCYEVMGRDYHSRMMGSEVPCQ